MKKIVLGLVTFAAVSFAGEYLNPYWFQDGEKEMIKKDYIESKTSQQKTSKK
ncbi:hypothetical protein [Nitrosophilus labii]|uniref:hypothetical protein n=1 Tax=Nitrosophilus labii TaxID=2706014 RepID=UPI00165749BD|nr:hypothetical protein [Nitrosophilus labii]